MGASSIQSKMQGGITQIEWHRFIAAAAVDGEQTTASFEHATRPPSRRCTGRAWRIALAVLAGAAVACGKADVGTAIDLSLAYDDALQLDAIEVTMGQDEQTTGPNRRLLLLVPDELAAMPTSIAVWGRASGARVAYGATVATPARGQMVSASLQLAACSPGCRDGTLITCVAPPVTCALGCASDGQCSMPQPGPGPQPSSFQPSNGVNASDATALAGATVIAADTTFNLDTGEVTGGLSRAAGPGDIGGIGYRQALPVAEGGAQLGVFAFAQLTIGEGVTVRFVGQRAAVLLIGGDAVIDGTIDVAAGRGSQSRPGPGGGGGGTGMREAQGCGPGAHGRDHTRLFDGSTGGGGGGGGGAGGDSGVADGEFVTGGAACLPLDLVPLQGGSGGGAGRPGDSGVIPRGGGGGGAIQITALGSIDIDGFIHAGGAGGEAGLSLSDAGSGAGGGAGGAILVEAPMVLVRDGAILAANGGGGGGGGIDGAGTNGADATDGFNGQISGMFALGGSAARIGTVLGNNHGGIGGALSNPAAQGYGNELDSGGGGGGTGAIVIRGTDVRINGLTSPLATSRRLP